MRDAAKTRWCPTCMWVYPWHECRVEMMSAEDEAAALAALEAVSEATPATVEHPTDDDSIHWYCGMIVWRTPDGWTVRVFNDCAEWDYLDSLIAPDGREWRYPLNHEPDKPLQAMTERLKDWKPTDESGWPGIDRCPP